MLNDLKDEGLELPSRRGVESELQHGLPPLPEVIVRKDHTRGIQKVCSWEHILNLVWQPILGYIESFLDEEGPQWTSSLQANHEALTVVIKGVVMSANETHVH